MEVGPGFLALCPFLPSTALHRGWVHSMPKGLLAIPKWGLGSPHCPARASEFQSQELEPGKVSRVLRQKDAHPPPLRGQGSTGDTTGQAGPFPTVQGSGV